MNKATVLASGEIFEVVGEGQLVTCAVINRSDVTAEVGARCANEMQAALVKALVAANAPFRGVVFDVRKAPIAFGPKTRAALAELFGRAETLQRRVAALVGPSPTQHIQFVNLQREVAPTVMFVSTSVEDTKAWATYAPHFDRT